jgi:hypothetical protein
MTTVDQTTDKTTVLTSGDSAARMFIIDHAAVGVCDPGEYLTAYTRKGDGWALTVDYFDTQKAWAVYVEVTTDEPLTTERLAAMLEAHEDAQGVADHMNTHPLTERLNTAFELRKEFEEFMGDGREADA